MKYISNKKDRGIAYDFNILKKDFAGLNCPASAYNPFKTHTIKSGQWYVDLSERSTGKTTNWLLLGLLMYWRYGTQIVYIREVADMIRPAHSRQLFDTILQYGYIEKITNGKYNSVKYSSRAWYLCNDAEVADSPFMLVLSLDENMLNKSSLNAPTGDLIIVDEFISRHNYSNQFLDLCDTIKTVIRERDSALIVMLANTIDRHSFWFKELGIYEAIQKMKMDSVSDLTNKNGTTISVALMGKSAERMPEHRKEHNARFFGFGNPKLNSITGGEWAMRIYPHPIKHDDNDTPQMICCNRYIRHNGYLLRLELFRSELLGLFVIVRSGKKLHNDSIVYTLEDIKNKNERYKWGRSPVDIKLFDLYKQNRFYYVTNLEGGLMDSYMSELKHVGRI